MPYFVLTVVPSDNRQNVALHALTAHVRPLRPSRPAILSISSRKMIPAVSTRSIAARADGVHVDELLRFSCVR
jgi:hypothetical protein